MNATTGPVDWDTARRVAARAARPGPSAPRGELEDLVAALRDSAGPAAEHAARVTKMTPADGRAPADASRVIVVDRAGWTRANVQIFAALSTLPDDAAPGLLGRTGTAGRVAAGVQLGGALALLAGKVLGQYDPFAPPPGADPTAPGEGRLLLVAPNVLDLERRLELDPADFRLWVSLHEQTHALQFAAAPWLSAHLRARFTQLLGDLSGQGDETFGRMVSTVGKVLTDDDASILDVLTTDQRVLVDEVGAVMSLLEGHADVAMDAVGSAVVPSVREIRRKFEDRRDKGANARGPAGVVRRLLGMDTKLAQYREGAAFVRAVRSRVGFTGLNAVWAASENLPTPAEIADPSAWVRRVHG